MYLEFYGLQDRPFDITPNRKYLYMTPGHQEVLTCLQYGISARKGIALLVGEAGTGKTTLLHAALDSQTEEVRSVYLSNPTLNRAEFLEFLALSLGLGERAHRSKVTFLAELVPSLLGRNDAGQTTVLVIDEAQSLPHELLEEVRLLANIETPTAKLLQVVLAGQPELADRLNDVELRQLKQRITVRCELKPLDGYETAAFIAGRLRIAAGDPASLFTSGAIDTVYRCSRGIPRIICVICDSALMAGFALERRQIDQAIVDEVCRDLDLQAAVDAPSGSKGSSRSLLSFRALNRGRDRNQADDNGRNAVGKVRRGWRSFLSAERYRRRTV